MPKDELPSTPQMKMKKAFLICPISEEGSEIRKRSDQILNYIITPVANDCGYNVDRADKISKPGIVTTQIVTLIINADLVIADLTGKNPNVLYELALCHALKKPTVQIIEKDEQLPFDIAMCRTIQLNHKDLDSVENAKKEIAKQIKAVEKDPMVSISCIVRGWSDLAANRAHRVSIS